MTDDERVSRRTCLAAASAVVGVVTAGCGGLGATTDRRGDDDTIEIAVENQTPEPTRIAVRVETDTDTILLSRVFEVAADHRGESADIGRRPRPATITAFTPGSGTVQWAYDPASSGYSDTEDVLLRVTETNGLALWYQY